MNGLYGKLKKDLGLTLILAIGLSVEFSNFQSMFYRFMLQYRQDWGVFNHLPAIFLSGFLLLCIVIFGIRKQTILSWFLALLTCVISFAVYSRMGLRWNWANVSEVHFVVLILSGMLPMLVAYTTHQISQEIDPTDSRAKEQSEMDGMMDQIRKMYGNASTGNGQRFEDEKKKGRTVLMGELEGLRVPRKSYKRYQTVEKQPKKHQETQIIFALPEHTESARLLEMPQVQSEKEVRVLKTEVVKGVKESVKIDRVLVFENPEVELIAAETEVILENTPEKTPKNKGKVSVSGFQTLHDEYEAAGFMEWVNPKFA